MELDLKPSQKKLADMKALGAKFRGEYLNEVTILEYEMEQIIINYFTSGHKEKSKELLHAFAGFRDTNYNTKRNLVAFISHRFPKFIKYCSDLDGYLQDVSAFRNIIAHQKMSLTPKDWNNFDYKNVNFFDTTTKDRKVINKPYSINQEKIDAEIKIVHVANNLCNLLLDMVLLENHKP